MDATAPLCSGPDCETAAVASSTAPAAAHEWAEADALLVELVRSGEVPAFPRNKSSLAALLPVLRAAKAGTAQAQLVKEEKLRGSKVYQQEGERPAPPRTCAPSRAHASQLI